jgi:small-conductance mechanosensitive channel
VDWPTYLSTFAVLVVVAAVAIGGYLLSRTAAERLRAHGAPPHAVRGVRIAITLVTLAIAALTLFAAFGPLPALSGLTLSAVLGIAATLALQTTIGNVIAGFILLHDRVLRLDDVVQISGVSGKVVQLGLVTTWLRMEDGSLATVSNSTLLSGPLLNRSASERLRGEY